MTGVALAFGFAFGLLFGIQGGLLISMVFDKWSKTAADWIMRRWFGGKP